MSETMTYDEPETIDPAAEADDIAAAAEKQAIDAVAQREGRVEEIRSVQKQVVRRQLHRALLAGGNDGAALMQDLPDLEQVDRAIDAQGDARLQRVGHDTRVAHLDDHAGEQRDATRQIFVDAQYAAMSADPEVVQEIDDHERRHRMQATTSSASNSADVPATGDAEADELLQLGSLEYREADAMTYAGYKHTSDQYVQDYLKPVNRVSAYLTRAGMNGDALVERAAMQGDVDGVRRAIGMAHRANMLRRGAPSLN